MPLDTTAISTSARQVKLKAPTLGELLAKPFRPREYLVTPLLRQGESMLVWAPTGLGKTWLTLSVALAVAGGGSFLGWTAQRPRRVLLVDGEMHAEDLAQRLDALMGAIEGIDREAALGNLKIISRQMQTASTRFPDLADRDGKDGNEAGQDAVLRAAVEWGAELLIADNLSTLAEVADENDAAAFAPVLGFLLKIKQTGIGLLLVHHSNKGEGGYRGSTMLATTFEVILGLKRPQGGPRGGAVFVTDFEKVRGERQEAHQPRQVQLVKHPDGRLEWTAEASEEDDVWKLLAAARSGLCSTQRELAAKLGWDAAKVTRTKQTAVSMGRVKQADFEELLKAAGQDARDGGPADF